MAAQQDPVTTDSIIVPKEIVQRSSDKKLLAAIQCYSPMLWLQ
jgi:hypothetical protein